MVAEAHHDIVQLFVGDEAVAMQKFVLVDRFGQLLRIGIQQAVRITELTTLAAIGMAIVGLTAVHERDRLLLK